MLKDQTENLPVAFTPYAGDPLRQDYRYGLGCWLEAYENGRPVEFGCQGAFGFSPWIDTKRGIAGIFFVQRTLASVNRTPSVEAAPYTLIRQRVRQILDAP
jgi:CubicO group peptidase (beta-lactamase class C family)